MRDDEFERLYAAEAQGLFAFLAYRTGDRALAEDLLADAFERALRSRGRFDRRRGSEKTWLYAIALNLLRDHARRAAAEGRALGRVDEPVAPDALEGVERREALDEARTARAELARATRLSVIGEMAGSIIHEINQPLAAIRLRAGTALRWLDRDPPQPQRA